MSHIFEKEKEVFLSTYKRIPVEIERGEGVYLYDKEGNKYLDFFSGLGVNALGYAHPDINEAIRKQIEKYSHLSNFFITESQIKFAEKILKYSEMSGIFLTNSGAEANEGVIKIIRKIKGKEKKIYALTGGFHGRTYGALTLTASEKYQHGFEPLLQNIEYVEFNDTKDLQNKVDINTAALFIEFIQGEGGIFPASEEFVKNIKALRKKFSFLLVADEIQCGIGRTGKAFGYNHYNVEPDIIVVAKSAGGGLPLGAILVSAELKEILAAGDHGTTFGGNPVACAAGNVVLEKVFEGGLLTKVSENGDYVIGLLSKLKEEFPKDIKEIRGKGYMVGIEHNYECAKLVEEFRNRGVLVNCTNKNVIRILPPLIAEKEHFNFFISAYREILKEKNQ
jgi:acetylornithine/N-succinyldiaminopimelate aminotransferase